MSIETQATAHGLENEVTKLHRRIHGELLPALKARIGIVAAEHNLLRFKVLGGLGPEATADFLFELARMTPAAVDREHLRLDVKSDPLMGRTNNPAPEEAMQATLDLLLADDGAPTALCMPCNTAHARIDGLRFDREKVRFVSMIDATVSAIASILPVNSTVGILATSHLLASGLYQTAFEKAGYEAAVPGAEAQCFVDTAIYGGQIDGRTYRGVKGGETDAAVTALIQRAFDELHLRESVSAVCLSCTELPLAFGPQRDGSFRGASRGLGLVNSTRALAHDFLLTALRLQAAVLADALEN